MHFTLGFSPCPNDTFIFDALVNGKIDTESIRFDVVLEDVQTLNKWAIETKLDFSKISYGVLPLVLDNYRVLNSGGALGLGVGPLLITNQHQKKAIEEMLIAIPGENTTAHLLFTRAFPKAHKKLFMVFNEIEEAVLSGKADAGVIIHENRFTYQQKGLVQLMDLGNHWEESLQIPVPLGGIVARRSIPNAIRLQVDNLIQKSLAYAYKQNPIISAYTKAHAQEMDESVMQQHIGLYVNDYSRNLGSTGKKSVMQLLEVYQQLHPLNTINKKEIFDSTL